MNIRSMLNSSSVASDGNIRLGFRGKSSNNTIVDSTTKPWVSIDTVSISSTSMKKSSLANAQVSTPMASFANAFTKQSNSPKEIDPLTYNNNIEYEFSQPFNWASRDLSVLENLSARKPMMLKSGRTVLVCAENYQKDGINQTRIIAKISHGSGESSLIEITKDTLISEDDEGNLIVKQGQKGILKGTDSDDVIISLGVSNIAAGAGNDTIIMLNNTGQRRHIDAGSGNNTIIAGDLYDAHIVMGDGDNTLIANYILEGTVRFGDGNNTLIAMYLERGKINFGNGDNTIKWLAGAVMAMTTVETGHGNNNISVATFYDSSIKTGDGDDNIAIDLFVSGEISGGGGNNTEFIKDFLTKPEGDDPLMTLDNEAKVHYGNNDAGRLIFTNTGYTDLSVRSELVNGLKKDINIRDAKDNKTIGMEDHTLIDSENIVASLPADAQELSVEDEDSATNNAFSETSVDDVVLSIQV